MTLDALIEIANQAYGDDLIWTARNTPGERGDTLALFIAIELKETFDPAATTRAKLKAAADAMATARGELEAVVAAFDLERLNTGRAVTPSASPGVHA